MKICFRGREAFEHGILEWTETNLNTFEDMLYKAGIFGIVAVSRYPYEYRTNVPTQYWGYMNHGLGEMATHPGGPGSANACLPIH